MTGIIDWEEAKQGDPACDYANWRFWLPDIDAANKARFPDIMHATALAEYGDNFPQRLRWAELRLGIRKVVWYASQGLSGDSERGFIDASRSATYLSLALARPLFDLNAPEEY